MRVCGNRQGDRGEALFSSSYGECRRQGRHLSITDRCLVSCGSVCVHIADGRTAPIVESLRRSVVLAERLQRQTFCRNVGGDRRG
jgi:hypothetical protein